MVLDRASAVKASPTGRFAAFSFVDRITKIEGVARVSGLYTIPPTVSLFPASLVAEAIGQLAAWVAMSSVGFTHRPVAALAGDTRMHSLPRPGDTLELIVDIESCDAESITYKGRALVEGRLILELQDTLGSMLDIHEFDAPAALAADFELLKTVGRPPGAFAGVPLPDLADLPSDRADRLEAAAGGPVRVSRITNVKVRAFTAPGASLVLSAEQASPSQEDLEPILIKVGASANGRIIAGAKIFFAPDSGEAA